MGNVTSLPLSHQNTPDTKLLDRVLEGLDDGQRARVLDLVVRLGINADDPLFLISLATSQLQILVQDAPNNWAHLFSVFEEDIIQWQKQNLSTLETLVLEAQAVHGLTESSKTLNTHIGSLQSVLMHLIETLEKSNQNSQHWQQSFGNLKRDLVLTLSANQNSSTVSSQPTSAAITHQTKKKQETSASTLGGNALVLGLIVGSFFIGSLQLMQIRYTQNVQQRQLNQLVERLAR